VLVEEKVDGRNFSFGLSPTKMESHHQVRSKSVQLNLFVPEKMFDKAIPEVQALTPSSTLAGPTERVPAEAEAQRAGLRRTPTNHLMVFRYQPGARALPVV